MKNLLFSDIPSNDDSFMKNAKRWRITSLVFCLVFAISAGVCFAFEYPFGENRFLILIASLGGFALFAGIFISTYCHERQFLIVFDSGIKYRKGFSRKEKQLILNPSEYKIKLKKFTHNGSYTVFVLFLNQKNHRLLSYKLQQSFTDEQKHSLHSIGCEIIDRQRILKMNQSF